jgi:hypothetical protein
MYFGTESYLKSNHNHTAKHAFRVVVLFKINFYLKYIKIIFLFYFFRFSFYIKRLKQ